MSIEERIENLPEIYGAFEAAAEASKAEAACGKGCSFCCCDAGRIHITTLEGLVLFRRIQQMPRARQVAVKKALASDRKRREAGQRSPCPLLMKTNACMIYADRPFVCRRIYSRSVCSAVQHPVVSKTVMELANATIASLQQLDDTGYSGHLSHILAMLDTPAFRKSYLAGAYRPEEIMVYGKKHGIVVNRLAGPLGMPEEMHHTR